MKAGGRLTCALVLLLTCLSGAARPQAAPPPSAGEVLGALQARFKQDQAKYEDLARRTDKAVRAALAERPWPEAGARHLADHPFFTLAASLAEAARASAKRGKCAPETQKLLARFGWDKDLELLQGLDYGSDRAIPPHENGFIDLGSAPEFEGLPALPVNQYLYGFDEIVGWQYRVKAGKKLDYEGRTAKDPPQMALAMPAWEQLRVFLQGTLPDVPLLAVPWLTHRLHARLVERRRGPDGALAPPDELLALMDSRWNGFTFQPAWSKDRVALVAPVRALFADRKGFVYGFPRSAQMESVGDLPFISVLAMQEFAQVMLHESIAPEDFIASTSEAVAATDSFTAQNAWLVRYHSLLDEVVRAILLPHEPYPGYLANSDFKSGKGPETRAVNVRHNVPRKHALVLWAWAEKDPDKLADFLHENLLDLEANRFPGDVPLHLQLSAVVQAREKELLAAVAERIGRDRAAGAGPGDFEREFSPYATYLTTDGPPHSDYLLHSYHACHGEAAAAVREAALAVVAKDAP